MTFFASLIMPLAPADEIRSGRFFIPPAPIVVDAERSPDMQRCLERLHSHDAFVELSQRKRLSDLPEWARSADTREVAYVYQHASAPDAFRYAVIRGYGGGIVIVRAGGLHDTYEIFELEAAEPGATDNPDDAQRLR